MDKKFKVAQVVCVFPPYTGGIGTVCANLSKYLVSLGHDVTVFTPAYQKDCIRKERVDGYKIERLPSRIKFGNAAVLNGLADKLNKFDIIDLHLPFLGTADLIMFLKLFGKIKRPIVSHYHMDLLGKNTLYKIIFSLEQKLLIPAMLKMSKKIFVSSQDYLANSKIHHLSVQYPDKFCIMPFGVDTKRFYPTSKDAGLVKKFMLEDKKVILFVGALDEAHYFKGVNYLLEAFARLADENYRLIIVGKGNLQGQYEGQAKDLQILDKTIFTGFVTDEDLPKYYNLADVFVLPSINSGEAFGIVLTEAMACGKPVIASDLPGVREVFGHYQKIISCKPRDADDLAKKIKKILSDQKLYKEIGKRNLLRAHTEFSHETIASELAEIYSKIISK